MGQLRTFVHASSESGDHYYFVFRDKLEGDAVEPAVIQRQKDEGWYYQDDEVDKPDEDRDCERLSIEHAEVSE